MEISLASKIKEANTTLIVNGNLDRIGNFFTQDYAVHLTDRVVKGGHDIVQIHLVHFTKVFLTFKWI